MNTVSVATVSHFPRLKSLKLLMKYILHQTYPVTEWVILDTSLVCKHKIESTNLFTNKNQIATLKHVVNYNFKRIYHKFNSQTKIMYFQAKGITLGEWRSELNDKCTSEIIVCADDDDYYPKDRVSHAVDKLINSNCVIAGCNNIYMYDVHYDLLCQYAVNRTDHATNSTFAYWKNCNLTYDHADINGEEKSFTKNFTVPMIQLDSDKCGILTSYSSNTVNKKYLIVLDSYAEYHNNTRLLKILDIDLKSIICENMLTEVKSYYASLSKPKKSEYDIVIYCGTKVLLNAYNWEALEFVSIFCESNKNTICASGCEVFKTDTNNKQLLSIEFQCYKFWNSHEILFIYGMTGFIPMYNLLIRSKILAKQIILYFEDIINQINSSWIDKILSIEKIRLIFKCKAQYTQFVNIAKTENFIYSIIPNGINNCTFAWQRLFFANQVNDVKVNRDEKSFYLCHVTDTRLFEKISKIWQNIYNADNCVKLYISKNFIKYLTFTLGVIEYDQHEKLSSINKCKYSLTYDYNISDYNCYEQRITAFQGCVLILPLIGMYAELPGIHISISTDDLADKILEIINNNYNIDLNSIFLRNWETTITEFINP